MRRLLPLLNRAIRPLATAANRARKTLRKARRAPRIGAHAIAMTPAGQVILVRLRYAKGWRLPGGGRSGDESVVDGALRELAEEIGMTGHGAVRPLACIDPSLILVEDVTYIPHRWSWEIEEVREAALGQLPGGMSRRAARWLAAFRDAR